MSATLPDLGPVQIVGIAWYRRGDWDALRALFADAHLLPVAYDDWLRRAERAEQQAKAQGKRVVRAVLRPQAFADWCTANGRTPDAAARTAWGNERAMAEYRQHH